jgi:hypothetical protein
MTVYIVFWGALSQVDAVFAKQAEAEERVQRYQAKGQKAHLASFKVRGVEEQSRG